MLNVRLDASLFSARFALLILASAALLFGGCTVEEDNGSSDVSSSGMTSSGGSSGGSSSGGVGTCTPGSERPAGDDCNTCMCMDSGEWACTNRACFPDECTPDECDPAPGAPNYLCEDGVTTAGPVCSRGADGACGWDFIECPGSGGACDTDDDCIIGGCSGQLCASESLGSTCEWRPEYACYGEEFTSCGCNDGVCGWARTDALEACLDSPPCFEGDTRPADDGCNTCECGADGQWSCTEIACSNGCYSDQDCADGSICNAVEVCDNDPSCPDCDVCYGWCIPAEGCAAGATRPADDGCNTCECGEDGQWRCTEIACVDGCYGDQDCADGTVCNAADVCATDPSCPFCTVCYGWCVPAEGCAAGETRPADDGCNTCECGADGQWYCTEMACGGNDEHFCADTGGTWDVTSCGHYSCGYAPECDAVIPGCDCGAGRSFAAGQGCVDDTSCANGDAAQLCAGTGGDWQEASCGHYTCGQPPACLALIPGCDCGAGRNYVEGQGCVDDASCGGAEAQLCEGTGGTWDPTSCGHYACGNPPLCDAIIPGCDCGPGQTFSNNGCVADPSCP